MLPLIPISNDCRNKVAPDSFDIFCKGMLKRYSQILKAVSTQKDSAKAETFETENEDFKNEV